VPATDGASASRAIRVILFNDLAVSEEKES
jgi:hypothetical protein